MDLIRKLFITLLIVVNQGVATAQTLHYKVVWRGDSVGYIKTYKFDSANFEVYKVKSLVTFWFFGRRSIKTEYSEVFQDQKLISAEVRYFKDEELRERCSTILKNSLYQIELNGDIQPPIMNPIYVTTTTLYYYKPDRAKSVYSERFGEMMPLEEINDSEIRIEKPNGRYNEYTFENGICKRVKVDNFFATLFFVRIDGEKSKNL